MVLDGLNFLKMCFTRIELNLKDKRMKVKNAKETAQELKAKKTENEVMVIYLEEILQKMSGCSGKIVVKRKGN